jgi:hypothetical protein
LFITGSFEDIFSLVAMLLPKISLKQKCLVVKTVSGLFGPTIGPRILLKDTRIYTHGYAVTCDPIQLRYLEPDENENLQIIGAKEENHEHERRPAR